MHFLADPQPRPEPGRYRIGHRTGRWIGRWVGHRIGRWIGSGAMRLGAARLGVACALVGLSLVPAAAFDPQTPADLTLQAHFTAPQDGGNDDTLEDALIALVDRVPAGEQLRGAFYSWSRQRVARAFVRAQARGVDVRLVVDSGNVTASGREYRAITLLREGLGDRLTLCGAGPGTGRDEDDETDAEGSATACIGSGIQHNKFVLISGLGDGSRDVIWQTSANPTTPQRRAFNDATVLQGDAALHAALLRYWQALDAQDPDPARRDSVPGDARTRAHFFPQAEGDTIVDILDRVQCSEGGQIHLAMARFTWPRRAVARKLAELRTGGCRVAAVLREGFSGQRIRDILGAGGVELLVFPAGAVHGVHSKYLLIDAPVEGALPGLQPGLQPGVQPVQMVVTGSHNYTGPALRRHDELVLEIADPVLYATYLDNWHMLRDRVIAAQAAGR